MKHHLIYVIVDSKEVPFYVGKTVDLKSRIRRHKSRAKTNCPLYLYNKLRKLMRENEPFRFDVVESGLTEEQVDDRERHWIAEYRKQGKLCNLSDGGEGGKGMTDATKEKIRAFHTGKKRSEETKKRISDGRLGMRFTSEHKKALSEARRKRITTDETRKKMRESSIGRINIKVFDLIDPNGVAHKTEKGLSDFCRLHNLQSSLIHKVLRGERTHHKGWKCNGRTNSP